MIINNGCRKWKIFQPTGIIWRVVITKITSTINATLLRHKIFLWTPQRIFVKVKLIELNNSSHFVTTYNQFTKVTRNQDFELRCLDITTKAKREILIRTTYLFPVQKIIRPFFLNTRTEARIVWKIYKNPDNNLLNVEITYCLKLLCNS